MENSNQSFSDESVSMGPAAVMTQTFDDRGQVTESFQMPDHSSYVSPPRIGNPHGMGHLSVSSILPEDCSNPAHLPTLLSPGSEFRPDILMSTVNNRQSSSLPEDLSISMGPIPDFDLNSDTQYPEDVPPLSTSLAKQIERFEERRNLMSRSHPPSQASAAIQTDELLCQKCEELHLGYNQKLVEVANEFQRQYSSQFQMMEQHAASSEDAQKQIRDLMEQLDGADKQLKASRVFLEQQAVEREQEREEAGENQKKLEAALADKEKECERGRSELAQLASEVQNFQDALKEKEQLAQEQASARMLMEQQLQALRASQADLDDENSSLQAVLEVKDKLLKAQAEQIVALQRELENQLYNQSGSEREGEATGEDARGRQPGAVLRDDGEQSVNSTAVTAGDMPNLFDELQQLIVRLLRKVDRSTKALESAQLTQPQKPSSGGSHLLSPRSLVTPSTSTEDISIKDRNRSDVDNLRELSPSPIPLRPGQSDPDMALSFLQQLDGKLAALGRIEEAACKRIADLEAELHRVTHSEKKSLSKASQLEEQCNKNLQLVQEIEAEKHELQAEHTELLKRISSLENRLEEQRRSAALGASQNPHAEKCRVLSEEKQQLLLAVHEKEESLAKMEEQISELHLRIDRLMKNLQEREQDTRRHIDFSQSSVERLRDAPNQDNSMTWSKLNVPTSPSAPASPIYQQLEKKQPLKEAQTINSTVNNNNNVELEELRTKLHKSESQRRVLEDELACTVSRLAQVEALERRNAALDDMLDHAEQEKAEQLERFAALEKERDEVSEQLEATRRRCSELEEMVESYGEMEEELESARKSCTSAEKDLVDHREAMQSVVSELQQRCSSLEARLAAGEKLANEYETVRRRCLDLEAEAAAHRSSANTLEALQQRYASLQAELIHQQQVAQKQCAGLKTLVEAKEKTVVDLQTKLQASDGCKTQVETALRELQLEVDAIKQVQQQVRTAEPKESTTLLEGPAAPPDLLAPSFIEFLGSTTSSRCSSRTPSDLVRRTAESTINTLHDFSLPSSMLGKTVLRRVQKESEQILAFGKQLLELQQKNMKRGSPNVAKDDDDLEATLKPDGESFEAVSPSSNELELVKKIELLETQLSLERLLLQDQRAANARQQQQMMQMIAQQRGNQLAPPKAATALRSLQPGQSGKFIQYRAMKLESIRKNLIYQKRFLTGLLGELDQNHNQRIVDRSDSKPGQHFRVVALAVVSIFRMRYVQRQWHHRRRMIEAQPNSD